MYETRAEPLLPRGKFLYRLAQHSAGAFGLVVLSLFIGMAGYVAFGLVVLSLFIGMAGYVAFERLSWLDAFLNAAMLLGGMGPIHNPATTAGKLFAGLYALYCGLVVIVTMGVVLAPILHRALHKFHLMKDGSK